jgi:hypothetical protein
MNIASDVGSELKYITGWGNHIGHIIMIPQITVICSLSKQLGVKVNIYCKNCDKHFDEIWNLNLE